MKVLTQQTEVIQNSQLQNLHELMQCSKSNIQGQNTKSHHFNQKKPLQNSHAYKAYIDGLRAIAISIVLIFHAWPNAMTGGYIGVDVFFVISGYLISGIVLKQTKNNNFSYSDFYSRRIRRIFPALIIVMVCTLIFGCVVYMQWDLRNMSQLLAASAGFGANIQRLIQKQSYWNPDAKKNPLLHLWSLGVQQQFYLIWPLVVALTLKLKPKKALIGFIIFTCLSFFTNIIAVNQYPKMAFYFPVCRFWQMSIGGIIAYINLKIQNKYITNILSSAGVLAICWWSLIPTLSSAFIILAGSQTYINKHLLSNKAFTFIGKISYPLYLWHWPIFAYLRYLYPAGSHSVFASPYTAVILSLVASILTYYFVQNPLRFHKSQKVVYMLFGIMIFILIISILIAVFAVSFSIPQRVMQSNISRYESEIMPTEEDFYIKNGKKIPNSSKNKNRKPATLQSIAYSRKVYYYRLKTKYSVTPSSKYWSENMPNQIQLTGFDVLNEGQANQVFMIGDSHAMLSRLRFNHMYQQLVKINKTSQFPTLVTLTYISRPYIDCGQFYKFSMDFIKKHLPKRVVFVQNINYFLILRGKTQGFLQNQACHSINLDQANFVDIFSQNMKQLINLGIQIYVVTGNPDGSRFNPNYMSDFSGVIENQIKPIKYSEFREEANKNAISLDYFETTLKNAGIKLIDLAQNQCWQDVCEVLLPTGYPIMRDDNHFIEFYYTYWMTVLDFLTQF